MATVLDDVGFDGIIIFYDGGDQLSVFCARCLRNHQARHNWRARHLSIERHSCASLKVQGPIATIVTGEVAFRDVIAKPEDEADWVI
jgi:hypothetical protein